MRTCWLAAPVFAIVRAGTACANRKVDGSDKQAKIQVQLRRRWLRRDEVGFNGGGGALLLDSLFGLPFLRVVGEEQPALVELREVLIAPRTTASGGSLLLSSLVSSSLNTHTHSQETRATRCAERRTHRAVCLRRATSNCGGVGGGGARSGAQPWA